jgi:hypothetical protein
LRKEEIKLEYRKVEKLIDNEWVKINFETLERGDAFRMFEPTGEEVIDDEGKKSWICGSDSYINDDGQWTVNIYKL